MGCGVAVGYKQVAGPPSRIWDPAPGLERMTRPLGVGVQRKGCLQGLLSFCKAVRALWEALPHLTLVILPSAAFIRVVGSEFVQKYLGEGPRMVRDVFRLAKENAPAIIFIDEIDAIATKRFDAQTGGE